MCPETVLENNKAVASAPFVFITAPARGHVTLSVMTVSLLICKS